MLIEVASLTASQGEHPYAAEKSDLPSEREGPRHGGDSIFEPFATFVRTPDMTG